MRLHRALKDTAKLTPSLGDEEPCARAFPALKYRAKLTPPLRGEGALRERRKLISSHVLRDDGSYGPGECLGTSDSTDI